MHNSILTFRLYPYFDCARIFFFSCAGRENSCFRVIPLSTFCSGLKLELSLICINHDELTETIESIAPIIKCFNVRITPEQT